MTQLSNCSNNSTSISSSISQTRYSKSTFHIPSDFNMDVECSSLLERLPKELLWIIFGFAPESIFDLRSVRFFDYSFHNLLVDVKWFKTCWLIQSLVDEYALISTRLVESLTFFEYRSIIRMEIHVPQNMSNMFELRLKLHQLPLRVEKRNPGRNECFNLNVSEWNVIAIWSSILQVYKLDVNPSEMIDERVFEDLANCIGRRIGKVVIRRNLKENMDLVSKILIRHRFEILGIVVDTLSDDDV